MEHQLKHLQISGNTNFLPHLVVNLDINMSFQYGGVHLAMRCTIPPKPVMGHNIWYMARQEFKYNSKQHLIPNIIDI